jgi:FKBP-type peptidyl-prolyl cis-trans isomerase FklB
MKTKNVLSIILIAAVSFSSCNGQKKSSDVKLTNKIDSVSYGIGLSIGNNLGKDGLNDLNLDVMMKAMRSAINKDSMLMDQQQAGTVIQSYLTEARKKKADEAVAKEKTWMDENAKKPGVITLPSGLQYTIIKTGTGPKPTMADTVIIHYHGTLLDGTVFDSSVERGEPITHPAAQFIPGWTEALQLMPVGSKWKLYIPSRLAYGEQGMGGKIEPNSTLIFEVELLGIKGK